MSAAKTPRSDADGALDPARLVGTWFLDEAYALGAQGERLFDLYGAEPSGVIHYGPDGRMQVLITHAGRTRLDGDRQAAPAPQMAAAYKSCIGYAGTYQVDGDCVLHHIDISTYPNWCGTVLKRYLSFDEDAAVLVTPVQMQDGVPTVLKLVWRRSVDRRLSGAGSLR